MGDIEDIQCANIANTEDIQGFKISFVNIWSMLRNSEGSQGLQRLIELCDSMSVSPNNNTAFIRFFVNELKDENYTTILLVILKSLRQLTIVRDAQKIVNSMIVALKTMTCDVTSYDNPILQVPCST